MKEDIFQKVIDELSGINFSGRLSPHFYGEPLSDKRLPELIEYARMKLQDCFIDIYTNGDFFNEVLFLKLINKGVDHFLITNYDNEEKIVLQNLQKKYSAHITLRSFKDFGKTDRAGEIFKRRVILKIRCLRPSAQLVINWKGDILLCCQDFYGRYVMGNVAEESILRIWNDKKFDSYREKLCLGQRSSIAICKHCDDPGLSPLVGTLS